MEQKLTFKGPSGEALSAILETPEKPNGKGILLLHCFMCTKHHRIMRNLSACLLGGGFTTLRFDFSGNGESGGKVEDADYTRMLGEIKEAVSILEHRGIKKIGIAGHSMGAMLALLAGKADSRITAVAFISGSSQAARVREVFPPEAIEKAETAGSAAAFVYGRDMVLKREFLLDVERYNVGHDVATLGKPLLIIHGTADEIIPLFHARQLFNWATGQKKLELIDGADHLFRKDEHLGAVLAAVCGWFHDVF
ncbi:MAG: alpha/beta fold hydrolase [Candidatus Micrarchaeota archaeon]